MLSLIYLIELKKRIQFLLSLYCLCLDPSDYLMDSSNQFGQCYFYHNIKKVIILMKEEILQGGDFEVIMHWKMNEGKGF